MLNPDEKARELVKLHLNYFDSSKDEIAEEKAKNAATITANEILQDLASDRFRHALTVRQVVELSSYWFLVKNEINLL